MEPIHVNLERLKLSISKLKTHKEQTAAIASYAKQITGATRCSIFGFHQDKDQLISIYNDGVKGKITLKSNIGLVGYAFHKRKTVLENNVAQSTVFFKLVDKKLNYKTNTVLVMPIINSDNKRLGVIQLLNKEAGFTQTDQEHLEAMSPLLIKLFNPLSEANITATSEKNEAPSDVSKLQKDLDAYLLNKKLYLMEDGSAYYKILNMKREYFIGADVCYQLTDTPKHTKIYYYTSNKEFLSLDMLTQIDPEHINLLVSENITLPKFLPHPLEEDED